MIKFGFILLGFAAFCAANNVTLSGDKWEWVIQNFSGFNYWTRNATWTINTDSNSTIKLFCPELKLGHWALNYTQNCENSQLVFSDGVKDDKICSSDTNVLIQGQTSRMVVNFIVKPNVGRIFYCKGKSVHPPRSYETINVPAGKTVHIKYPKLRERDTDQAFIFNSTSGSPITLKCTKKMEHPLKSGVCVKDILTIDNGNRTEVSCGRGHVSATGTQIKMRVETYQATEGFVSCFAKG